MISSIMNNFNRNTPVNDNEVKKEVEKNIVFSHLRMIAKEKIEKTQGGEQIVCVRYYGNPVSLLSVLSDFRNTNQAKME